MWMLNWLLIVAITLVSTSMLVFLSAYLAVLEETGLYYQQTRSMVLLLSNTFNLFYIIITPLLFPLLKKRYSLLVLLSVALTAAGCLGRYWAGRDYTTALAMSVLVAVGHIPIITAPYGLLELFPPEQRGYAATIPLFVPTLGSNFSIFYGMQFIASEHSQVLSFDKYAQIDTLNLIVAVMGCLSCIAAVIFMYLLRHQIRKVNEDTVAESSSLLAMIKNDLRVSRKVLVMLLSWGTIMGLNWTYGGMFGVFLGATGLSHKSIANVGLYANLSSVLFSNLGVWITSRFNLKPMTVIFLLNAGGFLASLYIFGSATFSQEVFRDERLLIVAIMVVRAGFSSFVSLALVELSSHVSSVLISSAFFYIANISNYLTIELVDRTSNSASLFAMSATVLAAIVAVQACNSSARPSLDQSSKKKDDDGEKLGNKEESSAISSTELNGQSPEQIDTKK